MQRGGAPWTIADWRRATFAARRTFEVVGDATVIVYDARNALNIRIDKFNNFAVDDMRVQLLSNGDRFSLINGERLP